MKDSALLFYLDNNLEDLDSYAAISEELGYRVGLYTNGAEMLSVLAHESEKPSIIFLNAHMPTLHGEEMITILKTSDEYKEIPVVMISYAYPKKLVREYLNKGANHLMKKALATDLKINLIEVFTLFCPTTSNSE